MTERSRRPTAAVLLLALLSPAAASAHLTSTGLGPFYDGLVHLFVTPVDLLAVVAVALWAGLNGARPGRWALFGLTAAWWLGGALGLFAAAHEVQALSGPTLAVAAAVPLGVGLAVALDLRRSHIVTTSAALLVGLGFGWLNGLALGVTETGPVPLFGILTAVFVCVALLAAVAAHVARGPEWRRVAVRVAGSWITAISLLMIGWALRPV